MKKFYFFILITLISIKLFSQNTELQEIKYLYEHFEQYDYIEVYNILNEIINKEKTYLEEEKILYNHYLFSLIGDKKAAENLKDGEDKGVNNEHFLKCCENIDNFCPLNDVLKNEDIKNYIIKKKTIYSDYNEDFNILNEILNEILYVNISFEKNDLYRFRKNLYKNKINSKLEQHYISKNYDEILIINYSLLFFMNCFDGNEKESRKYLDLIILEYEDISSKSEIVKNLLTNVYINHFDIFKNYGSFKNFINNELIKHYNIIFNEKVPEIKEINNEKYYTKYLFYKEDGNYGLERFFYKKSINNYCFFPITDEYDTTSLCELDEEQIMNYYTIIKDYNDKYSKIIQNFLKAKYYININPVFYKSNYRLFKSSFNALSKEEIDTLFYSFDIDTTCIEIDTIKDFNIDFRIIYSNDEFYKNISNNLFGYINSNTSYFCVVRNFDFEKYYNLIEDETLRNEIKKRIFALNYYFREIENCDLYYVPNLKFFNYEIIEDKDNILY